MFRIAKLLLDQKKPLRFLMSRLLMRSGLCVRLRIPRGDYDLIFFPTALSASLWVDPENRRTEETFLSSLLEPGDVVIDVGANIGSIALACARKVGPAGRVFAFEPHPRLFGFLLQNLALNHAGNVTAQRYALGAADGSIGFTDNSSDDENSVDADRGTIQVDLRCLDDLVSVERIRLVKVDVEGYEAAVIRGGKSVLRRTDILYFEASPVFLHRYGTQWQTLADELRGLGFTLYEREGDRLVSLRPELDRRLMVVALRAGTHEYVAAARMF